MVPLTIDPLGDRAILVHFSSELAASAWATAARAANWPGVMDVVLAYRAMALFFDPDLCEPAQLEAQVRELAPEQTNQTPGRLIVIPVLYDGPDLADVAAHFGIDPAGVIDEHSQSEYHVFAIGFLPGFPYAGYLPDALSGIPRRGVPRVRVPAGSVAIAGAQTGIYPRESPGGWHLIGRTPLCIADPAAGYFPVRGGDRLRFQPIGPSEFDSRCHERL
jgi:KipI family sensor histidine kinase inhibitor